MRVRTRWKKEKKLECARLALLPAAFKIFPAQGAGFREAERRDISGSLADPDTFEEGLCDESVTVTLDCSRGRGQDEDLGKLRKVGGCVMGREGDEVEGMGESFVGVGEDLRGAPACDTRGW